MGCGNRRMMDWAVTLLPQPDSPTIPRVSPAFSENETPSTARTRPSSVSNSVTRLLSCKIGPAELMVIDIIADGTGRKRECVAQRFDHCGERPESRLSSLRL